MARLWRQCHVSLHKFSRNKNANPRLGYMSAGKHPMSEAVLTCRNCANWMMENARIVSRREDAERLLVRAQRFNELADRLEQREQEPTSDQ
jgi:hypothetical protein